MRAGPTPLPPLGARRRRLMLEAPVEAPDGAGGTAITYAPLAVLWGSIEALAPGLPGEAGGPERPARARVTTRHRPGVTGAMRLRDGERVLAVEDAADPDGRRRALVITAREVAVEGDAP